MAGDSTERPHTIRSSHWPSGLRLPSPPLPAPSSPRVPRSHGTQTHTKHTVETIKAPRLSMRLLQFSEWELHVRGLLL